MRLPLLFLSILILCSVTPEHVFAQQIPHTLLWRIQGNGLDKPCYLYGTMHVEDRKAFYFTDSLYHALENTDGFAMEMHPDSVVSFLMGQISGKMHKDLLRDMMKKDDYVKMNEQVRKQFGVSADNLTKKDAFLLREQLLTASRKKADDMPTFVDAYLYGLARGQGKRIAGLETPAEQEAFLDVAAERFDPNTLVDDRKPSHRYLDSMVSVYAAQDLGKLDQIVRLSMDSLEERAMYKRNRVMIRSMDSLFKTGTYVVAVGSAHLPGDSGLIGLLRGEGYVVEPVRSAKRIAPGDYVFQHAVPDSASWTKVRTPGEGYDIYMPGTPRDLKVFSGMNMKMYVDLSTALFYETGSAPVFTTVTAENTDSLLSEMEGRITNSGSVDILSKTPYKWQGHAGLRVTLKKAGNGTVVFMNTVFLLTDQRVYFMILGSTKNIDAVSDGGRFFHSLALYEPVINRVSKRLEDTAYHFAVTLPGVDSQDSVPDGGGKTQAVFHTVMDEANGNMYTVTLARPKPGYFLSADSQYFAAIFENMRNRFADSAMTGHDTTFQGRPAFAFLGRTKRIQMRGLVFKRDNYGYCLIGFGARDSSVEVGLDSLAGSFTFLEIPQAPWDIKDFPAQQYQAFVPGKEIASIDSGEFREWIDPGQLDAYVIRRRRISPYAFATDDSTLLKNEVWKLRNKQDETLTYSFVKHQGLPGIQYRISQRGKGQLGTGRIYIDGDMLYHQYADVFPDREHTPEVERFFDSLRLVVNTTPVRKGTSGLLYQDLQSADSATRAGAIAYIDSATLDLRGLLTEMASRFDNEDSLTIHTRLKSQALKQVVESDLPLVSSLYRLPAYPERGRYDLLQVAVKVRSAAAIDTLLGLLAYKQPTEGTPFFAYRIGDSLPLARRAYPALFRYAGDTVLGAELLSVEARLLRKGLLTPADFAPYKRAMEVCATALAHQDSTDNDYDFSLTVEILRRFSDTGTVRFFRSALALPTDGDKFEAASALLHLGAPVPAATLQTLAVDKLYRVPLYDTLEAYHQVARYPVAYHTQGAFAAGYLYQSFQDDDDDDEGNGYPVSMTLLKQGLYTYKGKKRKFYTYAIRFKDSDKAFLGVAGPFDAVGNGLHIDAEENESGCYYRNELDRAHLDKQVMTFLNRFADDSSSDTSDTDTP